MKLKANIGPPETRRQPSRRDAASCSICLMLAFDGQLGRRGWLQRRVEVISGASGKAPTAGGARGDVSGCLGWGGQRECVSTPPHHRAAAGCQTEICGCGLTGTSLSGSVACTPHGAHRLIPRLKFTFAPSRLNSHFSSSHNTPLSRDTEKMGSSRALHAKQCTIAARFWGVHINTVYQTLHE